MNLTIGRRFSFSRWHGAQHLSLVIGLAIALTAGAIGHASSGTSGPSNAYSSAVREPSATPPETPVLPLYIVESEARAAELAAIKSIDPVEFFVASGPEAEKVLAILFMEDAHGVFQNTRVVDLRDR